MYLDLCLAMAQVVVAGPAVGGLGWILGGGEQAIHASFVVDKVSMRQVFLLSNFSLSVCFH